MLLKFLFFVFLFIFSNNIQAYNGHLDQYSFHPGGNSGVRFQDQSGYWGIWEGRHSKTISGRNLFGHFCLKYSRQNGAWQDYLTNTNTYQDCILEQAYHYLQHFTEGWYNDYSNISEVRFKKKMLRLEGEKGCDSDCIIIECEIPYIEGSCINPDTYYEYRFRLYLFPTNDDKTTYFLFITNSEQHSFMGKKDRLDDAFEWVKHIGRIQTIPGNSNAVDRN